jgi:hypothetical protein
MGFATHRDGPDQRGLWTTHRWVTDEIATANAQEPKIPFVEIREVDVDPQLGIGSGKSYIRYDEKERDREALPPFLASAGVLLFFLELMHGPANQVQHAVWLPDLVPEIGGRVAFVHRRIARAAVVAPC